MSDLIERLGKLQDSCTKQQLGLLDTDYVWELAGRSADEIERLKAENKKMRTTLEQIQANYTKRGLIKRLCLQSLPRDDNES